MVALELMQEVLSMNKTLQEYAHAERLLAILSMTLRNLFKLDLIE